jgi:hypothetical protein
MGRRALWAAPLLAALLLFAATAEAAPVELTVRIEGATKTLFEGPILSDGHDVRASSDSRTRHCDGTNGGAHPGPGPTPTAAAVDAMGLIGEDFDGRWYPGFDDYLVERWGPDAQDPEASVYWGLLVNGVLSPVGGCQWQDAPGDEVLWAYDAFTGRSFLRLSAASAAVEVGQPLAVFVQSYAGGEGEEPKIEPAGGVTVAPVITEPGTGFQTVEEGSPEAVVTGADGTASVSFASPGWHRLKAQEDGGFIRSNRLDVCVEPVGGGSCGPLPEDARLRVPDRYPAPFPPGGSSPSDSDSASPSAVVPPAPSLRLGRLLLDRRIGAAKLTAIVSGSGRLRLSGRGVRPSAAEAGAAGNVLLPVRPGPQAIRSLRRTGRFKTTVRVAFSAAQRTVIARRDLVLRQTKGRTASNSPPSRGRI